MLDLLGEGPTLVLVGLIIGGLFGIAAQRSAFCLRAAVIELVEGGLGRKMAIWLLAFSAAVLGTQALIHADVLDVTESRQLSNPGSLSGAILGGALFGVGMILTRGCVSRLLVLSATGNLRALLTGLMFAVVAQATISGALAPVREWLAQLVVLNDPVQRDLLAVLGQGAEAGLILAVVFLVGAVGVALRARLSAWLALGAAGVGLVIALGWGSTYAVSLQAFEPVQVESLSFTGPSADVLMTFLGSRADRLDFDLGLIPGVFLGSFLAAWLARDLKLQGFEGGARMRRYIIGAACMGFGGMLAAGCAVGAGVTGGAIFALNAWVTLVAIWGAAALTHLLVDGRWALGAQQPQAAD